MRLRNVMKFGIPVAFALAIAIAYAPVTFAGAPGPVPGSPNQTVAVGHQVYKATVQDHAWLVAKSEDRVRSGLLPNQPKNSIAHPYMLPRGTVQLNAPPTGFLLPTNNPVPGTWEPSDGNWPNFGPSSAATDDSSPPTPYNDHDFFFLCGPGAADIALYYWPWPFNGMHVTVTDTAHTSTTTYWSSERMRGYMTHLAWQIQWPGWPHQGMMDNAHYWTYGTTLYGMQDALNWEASGEDTSNWSNYFYVIMWWSDHNDPNVFHSEVVSDVVYSSVPVVAEVNAAMLPNWNEPGNMIHHFITIIGYDDTTHEYWYTDTCGKSTGCGNQTYGSDGGLHLVDQTTLWNAIVNIPVNKSTDPSAGDGGWVW